MIADREEEDRQYFNLLNCINLKQFDGHRSEVTCATFSRDYDMMVTGSDDFHVRVYNTHSTVLVTDLEHHTAPVKCVAVSNDTRYFASCSDDKTVSVLITRTCECIHTLRHKKGVETITFLNDSRRLVSGSWDDSVRFWDLLSGACLLVLTVPSGARCVAVDALDTYVAVGSWDKQVRLWHLPRDFDKRQLHKPLTLKGSKGSLLSLAISINNYIAAAGCSKEIYLWYFNKTDLLLKIETEHIDWIVAIAFSPNGQLLCSVAKHDTVRFWEVETGDCSRKFDVIAEHAYYCGFTQRGTAVIASCALSSNAELMTYMWSTLSEADAKNDKKTPARSKVASGSTSSGEDTDDYLSDE